MKFDDVYQKCFEDMYRYCYYRNGGNRYLAEEAAKKTLDVMYAKWKTVGLYEEKRLYAWLYGVAENKMKEVMREQPPITEPFDEPWCRDLVEEQQYKHGAPLDEETEHQRFLQYSEEIEKQLKPKEHALFHYKVVDRLPNKAIGAEMHLTENAVKLRWLRLEEKLRPITDKLLNCK